MSSLKQITEEASMAKLEVHTIPIISTAHLTKVVAERLDQDASTWCCGANYQGCGYFLYLDEPCASDAETVPQCLLDIRDWRMRLEKEGMLDNSRWVRLDWDAEAVEGLPVYEW
jgi:hypothetical protein